MTRRIVTDLVAVSYIILFVYAATTKLMAGEVFRVQLSQSPLIADLAPVVAWVVPIAELIVAVALMFDRFRLIGFYAAFGLMVMFTAYIVLISSFSEFVPCSCGGVIEKLTWTEHLFFNAFFVVFGAAGILLHPKDRTGLKHNVQPEA